MIFDEETLHCIHCHNALEKRYCKWQAVGYCNKHCYLLDEQARRDHEDDQFQNSEDHLRQG